MQQSVRNTHITEVLNYLRANPSTSRADLSRQLGLAKSSMSSIIEEMLLMGLIIEAKPEAAGVGKPSIGLSLNPMGGAAIAVEINSGYVSVMLTNFLAETLWDEVKSIVPGSPRETYLEPTEQFIEKAIRQAAEMGLPVLGIGVGISAVIEPDSGMVVSSASLSWQNVPLKEWWESKFNLPVVVDTEANMGAKGEHRYGCAQGLSTFLYLDFSYGDRKDFGMALMLDGKLWRGVQGFAGRLGHMVLDPEGPLCECGQRGCWRVMASDEAEVAYTRSLLRQGSPSMLQQFAADDYAAVNPDIIHMAAINGDRLALSVLQYMSKYREQAISTLVNILDPGTIVTAFSFTDIDKPEVGEITVGLMDVFKAINQGSSLEKKVNMLMTNLGAQSALLGAAYTVLERYTQGPHVLRVRGITLMEGSNGNNR